MSEAENPPAQPPQPSLYATSAARGTKKKKGKENDNKKNRDSGRIRTCAAEAI